MAPPATRLDRRIARGIPRLDNLDPHPDPTAPYAGLVIEADAALYGPLRRKVPA